MDKNTQQELIKELRGMLEGILEPKEFKNYEINCYIFYDYIKNEFDYSYDVETEDIGKIYLKIKENNDNNWNDVMDTLWSNVVQTLNSHSITPSQLKQAYKSLGWL
ncbi:MAG: hypothetical protein SOV85_01800 [Clostridium sp.]|uniref:hypothetical protein n=1 Tax=Clostridium sp. TaxID=1506 RepID=UPI002A750181|nr:hypothetical protein [Clostridium sp.]MDY2630077.1 hypothetical protein [Clostridium sp.]